MTDVGERDRGVQLGLLLFPRPFRLRQGGPNPLRLVLEGVLSAAKQTNKQTNNKQTNTEAEHDATEQSRTGSSDERAASKFGGWPRAN